jgi:hypothetical protein
MKRMIIYAAIFFAAGCGPAPSFTKETVKCRVDSYTERFRYPGLLPDKFYVLKTSCGYVFSSNRFHDVGDSITVQIHTMQK